MSNENTGRDLDQIFRDAIDFAAKEEGFEIEHKSQRIPNMDPLIPSKSRSWYEVRSDDGVSQVNYHTAENRMMVQVLDRPTDMELDGCYNPEVGVRAVEKATAKMEDYDVAEFEELDTEYVHLALKISSTN